MFVPRTHTKVAKMFLERSNKAGWIEVICGSMFSGKTEELIRRLKRANFAHLRVQIFKPELDVRYSEESVVSHDRNSIQSIPVDSSQSILLLATDVDVVGIDEVQFFDDGIVNVCNTLANNGIRVICAGLDTNYLGEPFGPMPALMAVAEYVTKVHAICVKCGQPANHSHRISGGTKLVELGEQDKYEPLCRHCFNAARKKEEESEAGAGAGAEAKAGAAAETEAEAGAKAKAGVEVSGSGRD